MSIYIFKLKIMIQSIQLKIMRFFLLLSRLFIKYYINIILRVSNKFCINKQERYSDIQAVIKWNINKVLIIIKKYFLFTFQCF